jgi:carbon-monoxide dehydrogenase medium subunit/6-hydroxypseudooxynicotine dehydrogenase subunit alpha
VKAPPFAYARAASVDDALALLAEAGEDAKLVAGGQSLLPLLGYRLVRPSHLVDIDAVQELAAIDEKEGWLHLGALTRHAWLESQTWHGSRRLLGQAAGLIGHLPIRTRGTLGGSVAHADPAAELPVALLALGARVAIRSATGGRIVPVDDFFRGPFATALEPCEIVTAVLLPPCRDGSRGAFVEFAIRSGDFALASAAVAARVEDGCLRDVRVALGGVDATAVRSAAAESTLEGAGRNAFAAAAAAAAAGCHPASDQTADASYRRTLVERLVGDALEQLMDGP